MDFVFELVKKLKGFGVVLVEENDEEELVKEIKEIKFKGGYICIKIIV